MVRAGDLMKIRSLIPDEVWQQRAVFFHEGMQMQIGPVSKQHTSTGGERAEHLGVQRLLVAIECGVKDEAHGGSIGGPLPQESTNPAMRPA
jgi:hypothetical protein